MGLATSPKASDCALTHAGPATPAKSNSRIRSDLRGTGHHPCASMMPNAMRYALCARGTNVAPSWHCRIADRARRLVATYTSREFVASYGHLRAVQPPLSINLGKVALYH